MIGMEARALRTLFPACMLLLLTTLPTAQAVTDVDLERAHALVADTWHGVWDDIYEGRVCQVETPVTRGCDVCDEHCVYPIRKLGDNLIDSIGEYIGLIGSIAGYTNLPPSS